VAVDEPFHRAIVHRCTCKAGTCDNVPDTAIGGEWLDGCPYVWLRSDYWHAICGLLSASHISPLAGWPDCYPAGIVSGMLTLRHAIDERAAREQREAIERAKRG
jgi:hypothetical protein